MKSLLFATLMSVAFSAAAHAQTAPAPAPKMECCEKMKAEGKDCCCKDMAKKDHSGHGAKAPSAPPTDAGHNHRH